MHRFVITMGALAILAGCASPAPAPPATAAAPAATTRTAPLVMTPPTAAAARGVTPAAGRVTLNNPGFESTKPGARGDPEGWYSFQHAGPLSYKFTTDTTQRKSGQNSLRIDNTGPEIYGAIAQIVDGRAHRGKVARYSAWVKLDDVNSAVLTLLAMQSGATLAQNFMPDAPIKGTADWTRYTITLALPPATDRLEVGLMTRGRGTVWLDDAELEIVDP